MNALIKELAEQAESHANSKIHMTGWNYREEYNKKFAQLVARRCIQVALDVDDPILAVEMADLFGIDK